MSRLPASCCEFIYTSSVHFSGLLNSGTSAGASLQVSYNMSILPERTLLHVLFVYPFAPLQLL